MKIPLGQEVVTFCPFLWRNLDECIQNSNKYM